RRHRPAAPPFPTRRSSDLRESVLDNAFSFLGNMQPSLIYGLHRRQVLRACVPSRYFDLWDCALVFKVLLRSGVRTVPAFKYRAGIHTKDYEIKTASADGRRLSFRSAAWEMLTETWRCDRLGVLARLRLSLGILRTIAALHRHLRPLLEQQWKSKQASRLNNA